MDPQTSMECDSVFTDKTCF